MRMAAHNRIKAAYSRSHFKVHVHAVMRQQDDNLSALTLHFIDHLLQILFLNTKGPVGREVARIGNRRIGEGLANDGNRNAIHVTDGVRTKYRVTKVSRLDILRNERDLTLKILLHDFHHALFA